MPPRIPFTPVARLPRPHGARRPGTVPPSRASCPETGPTAPDEPEADERPCPAGRASVGDCVLIAALCTLAGVTFYRTSLDAPDSRTVASALPSDAYLEPRVP